MSKYTLASIPLAAIPGIHGGTGSFQNPNWLVLPSSVPGSGNLQFVGKWVQVTTMLFEISDNVVPNWFGVAIPSGIQDFSKAHVFFHPMPAQAGYLDSDYATKAGIWPQLFYYMERLGYQMDGAARSQIIIMPFLKNAATDTGIFLNNWFDIVTDILTAVRAALGADDGSTLALSQIVVSSFSVGIVYSSNFRIGAPNLSTFLTEVWDFDGLFSSSSNLSRSLVSTAQYQAIKYDQDPSSGSANFHVPRPRWADYVDAPTTSTQTHSLIRDFMFLHAATVSTVGGVIDAGGAPSASSGPADSPDLSLSPSPDSTPAPALSGQPGSTPDFDGPVGSTPISGDPDSGGGPEPGVGPGFDPSFDPSSSPGSGSGSDPGLAPALGTPSVAPEATAGNPPDINPTRQIPMGKSPAVPPNIPPPIPRAIPDSTPYPPLSTIVPRSLVVSTQTPAPPSVVTTPVSLMPHTQPCDCACCCSIAAAASAVATTSTVAITAITSIVSFVKRS